MTTHASAWQWASRCAATPACRCSRAAHATGAKCAAGCLRQGNDALNTLNLEWNRINNAGAQVIARSLIANHSLLELNLLNQKGMQPTYGDATLSECATPHQVNPCLRPSSRQHAATAAATRSHTLLRAQIPRHVRDQRHAPQDRVAPRVAPELPPHQVSPDANQTRVAPPEFPPHHESRA